MKYSGQLWSLYYSACRKHGQTPDFSILLGGPGFADWQRDTKLLNAEIALPDGSPLLAALLTEGPRLDEERRVARGWDDSVNQAPEFFKIGFQILLYGAAQSER